MTSPAATLLTCMSTWAQVCLCLVISQLQLVTITNYSTLPTRPATLARLLKTVGFFSFLDIEAVIQQRRKTILLSIVLCPTCISSLAQLDLPRGASHLTLPIHPAPAHDLSLSALDGLDRLNRPCQQARWAAGKPHPASGRQRLEVPPEGAPTMWRAPCKHINARVSALDLPSYCPDPALLLPWPCPPTALALPSYCPGPAL